MSDGAFRREILKAYLVAMAQDGEFIGTAGNPIALVISATRVFAGDAPKVVEEIVSVLAAQQLEQLQASAQHYTARASEALHGLVDKVGQEIRQKGVRRTLRDLWKRVEDAHAAGMDANGRRG